MEKAPTARALARQTVRAGILAAARARLTDEGPVQLSLRAVARDVGLVSSAVYRYFASRDDLLTALLIEDYDELGAAVESADAACAREDVGARWRAACHAVRDWSRSHPGDFALLFGSPVPGYVAPRETVAPATRATVVLVQIAIDATDGRPSSGPQDSGADPALASAVADATAFVRDTGLGDRVPTEVIVRTIMAWTALFGTVSFELFGHYVGSVTDPDAYFDAVVTRLAADIGFAC